MTEKQFTEICQKVCRELNSSGSPELDQEAAYYAICWQLCEVLRRPMRLDPQHESKLLFFQTQMQALVADETAAMFVAVKIAASIVDARLLDIYCGAEKSHAASDNF